MALFEEILGFLIAFVDGVLGFLGGFMATELLVVALVALVIAVLVFRMASSFVFRLLAIAFIVPNVYTILISFDSIRESTGGQTFATLVAIGVAIVLVGQTFAGASRGQKAFDFLLELALVFAFIFFASQFFPDSTWGAQAQAVIEDVMVFWERIFDGARQTLE